MKTPSSTVHACRRYRLYCDAWRPGQFLYPGDFVSLADWERPPNSEHKLPPLAIVMRLSFGQRSGWVDLNCYRYVQRRGVIAFADYREAVAEHEQALFPRCCGRGTACPALRRLGRYSQDNIADLVAASSGWTLPEKKRFRTCVGVCFDDDSQNQS